MVLGQIVQSLKGRDKEKYFVVIDMSDEFLYICDGKTRHVCKPKKKKIKHIKATEKVNLKISDKLKNKDTVLDKEIKEVLSNFLLEQGILESEEV